MAALGRGLGSLISNDREPQERPGILPIAKIRPNPHQPRKVFVSEGIEALRDSIEIHGVLQPICVRPFEGAYQIVAGERRWRAARLAGLTEIPVVIQEADEARTMELALIENLQREDLDPIEKAKAFRSMMDQLSYTQEKVAQRVGVSRAAVANHLRLLELPSEVQEAIVEGLITFGHAKALAGLAGEREQKAALARVVRDDLSVRDTERLAKGKLGGGASGASKEQEATKRTQANAKEPAWKKEIQRRLERVLGLPVEFHCDSNYSGRIQLKFSDRDQLEVLLERLAPSEKV